MKYITYFKEYNQTGDIDSEPGRNSITFTNVGGSIARVNGVFKLPAAVAPDLGGTLSIEGNSDETDNTKYFINFEGGSGAVVVASKVYIK
jgi:hypothetical protein